MNCQKAKTIQITNYLSVLGFKPVRIVKNNYWYKSMIRQNESQASFKVDANQNCWYDHGLGEGGNILDLVMKIHRLNSVSEALRELNGNRVSSSFSFHQLKKNLPIKETDQVQRVEKLSNRSLVQYITEVRGISEELALQYCSEVYYKANERHYYAIGFLNDVGGWELRNKYWKGCIGSKAITTLFKGHPSCCVFEGFIDFLSFLQLFPEKVNTNDFIILNSLSKVEDVLTIVAEYNRVNLFLDNDTAGENATRELLKSSRNMMDQSHFYNPFVDLNEYLLGNKILRS